MNKNGFDSAVQKALTSRGQGSVDVSTADAAKEGIAPSLYSVKHKNVYDKETLLTEDSMNDPKHYRGY